MDSSAKRLVIGYQGTDGAYSQMAAERHFAQRTAALETRGYDSFAQLLQAVIDEQIDYAMQPIENTTAGSINDAYDLLARLDLHLVGEEVLKVEHCLAVLPGTKLDDVRRVYSHPQALLQSSDYLAKLRECEILTFTDTAMAMRKVRDDRAPEQAAVASERAAALYGLEVLARDIANQKSNYTRFVVAAKRPAVVPVDVPCKTSLILTTRHEQGALVRCLSVLADHKLNLTKIESRPRPNTPFEYVFYLDFEGNIADPNVAQAIERVRSHTLSFRVLGSFPARPRS
ncbi:MAG: prephenate dehydratase [Polyangiales bacterium]